MRVDTFGKRLRDLRGDYEWTQQQLAERIEAEAHITIGQNYISQLENGRALPSMPVAVALARVLHTTLDYLMLLSDNPEPPDGQPIYITPEADELARLVDTLPAEARAELLAIARRLARPVVGRAEREREALWWLTRVEAAAGPSARQALERAIMSGDFPPND